MRRRFLPPPPPLRFTFRPIAAADLPFGTIGDGEVSSGNGDEGDCGDCGDVELVGDVSVGDSGDLAEAAAARCDRTVGLKCRLSTFWHTYSTQNELELNATPERTMRTEHTGILPHTLLHKPIMRKINTSGK